MAADPHKIRELVLLLLYSFEMSKGEEDELLKLLKEECKVSSTFVVTALQRARTVVASLAEIDKVLEKISYSYSIERLQSMERNILRLAIFELIVEKEIPPKVILAEAKRLAKKFSTGESAVFVGTLLVALCAGEQIEM